MKQKRTKSGVDSVLKGNTGEFYALAELSRHGWTAAQTARNTRLYDILARKDSRQVALRVKTKTSDALVFQWNAKPDGRIFGEIGADDFCILVDIPESHDEFPQFYIVPTKVLEGWLIEDFNTWLETPGKIKQQRSAANKRRLFYMDEDASKSGHGYLTKLSSYRDWKILERD
ncbi:MAG TPA: hypothetical protein VH413_01685 [Verrucomicrobiae bacterium]|jgi:hypothetical protein|nr:hypothetical protein [Verrucomicrobiae bacterium]